MAALDVGATVRMGVEPDWIKWCVNRATFVLVLLAIKRNSEAIDILKVSGRQNFQQKIAFALFTALDNSSL